MTKKLTIRSVNALKPVMHIKGVSGNSSKTLVELNLDNMVAMGWATEALWMRWSYTHLVSLKNAKKKRQWKTIAAF